jgi:signal transduction histidine kinase
MTIYIPNQQADPTPADWRDHAGQPDVEDVVRKLAHDLRQPIAAIRALAAAAAADAQAPEAVLQRLRQIGDEANWISKLIDDLLADFRSHPAHPLEPVELCTLLRDVVISERLTYRGRIACDYASGEGSYVIAPATRLRRAVANVLANATRAAGSAGNVRLTERAYGDMRVIEIADDGPGFGQVPQAHGLGLQITRQVLAECRGRMEIERRPDGQTLVRLILPTASKASGAGIP